jgi:hypothetical protein
MHSVLFIVRAAWPQSEHDANGHTKNRSAIEKLTDAIVGNVCLSSKQGT